MSTDPTDRIDALEAEVRALREAFAKLESDLISGVKTFRPYKVKALEVRYVRDATGCSIQAAKGAVMATRGDLPAAVEQVNRQGLASCNDNT